MTQEILLNNVFFGVFYFIGQNLLIIFAGLLLGSIIFSLLNFLLGVDRYRP